MKMYNAICSRKHTFLRDFVLRKGGEIIKEDKKYIEYLWNGELWRGVRPAVSNFNEHYYKRCIVDKTVDPQFVEEWIKPHAEKVIII